jgi:hypothetical protein
VRRGVNLGGRAGEGLTGKGPSMAVQLGQRGTMMMGQMNGRRWR